MLKNNEENFKNFLLQTGKRAFVLYFWMVGFSTFSNYIRNDDKTVQSILFDALLFTFIILIFYYREDNRKKKEF